MEFQVLKGRFYNKNCPIIIQINARRGENVGKFKNKIIMLITAIYLLIRRLRNRRNNAPDGIHCPEPVPVIQGSRFKGILKNRFFPVIFLLAVTATSCVDDIELNLDPEEYERLIVHAMVTDTGYVQFVDLRKTIPYDKNTSNPAATDAIVTIEVDGITYQLTEVSPGYYETREFIGETGKTYVLNILYEEQSYTATSTMAEGFEIDSIGAKRFSLGWPADMPHYEILLYGQESTDPDQFYLFKHSLNGVWADTLYYWGLYTDTYLNGRYLDGESIRIIESPEDSIEIGVLSMSISEEYFWFVNNAIMNYMPNMFFSPPKANVMGNISNDAFGFFLATSIRESEKKVLHKKDYGW
jgi:hypothetical protein